MTKRVAATLPAGWRIMPIGAVAMMELGLVGTRTKDADYVPMLTLDGNFRIPDETQLRRFAETLGGRILARRDETSLLVVLEIEAGPVKVELIRGRNPQSGGYFVTRRVLEASAKVALDHEGVLTLPPDALAFLKAWAATDQDKLVEAGKDRTGFHAARASAFRQDVQRIAQSFLDHGDPLPAGAFLVLLDACPAERRKRIRAVLSSHGWQPP